MQFAFQVGNIVPGHSVLIFYTGYTLLVILKTIKKSSMQIATHSLFHQFFYISILLIVRIKEIRE